MQDTYIKLDRSLLKLRYFDNVNVLKVWLWCLMKASYTERERLVGLKTVRLKTGEFVTGRNAASRDLNLPGSTVWTILKLFENDKKIVIKSNNKFSVISVIDYQTYQVLKYQPRQQNGQQTDSTLTATGQQPDTNKKEKKEKKTYAAFLSEKIAECFELFYEDYPRKERKKEARKFYLASVKTSEDMGKIESALDAYIAQCKKKDRQFIMQAGTWFNNWQDYTGNDWQEIAADFKTKVEAEYEDYQRKEDGAGADCEGLL
jgi:hypothetical protein